MDALTEKIKIRFVGGPLDGVENLFLAKTVPAERLQEGQDYVLLRSVVNHFCFNCKEPYLDAGVSREYVLYEKFKDINDIIYFKAILNERKWQKILARLRPMVQESLKAYPPGPVQDRLKITERLLNDLNGFCASVKSWSDDQLVEYIVGALRLHCSRVEYGYCAWYELNRLADACR